LTDCLETPVDKLRLMGEAGHQRVIVRHDIDTEAKKLVELFEK
ncbi:MAG: colanic acid biosynthesis glycosyltransferase WcaL, partial [Gammaproteobacteria bacterium]|nr:colanic acid biosynthesis glycosyltransferase WcaL [Gammaproteobacteria bacterium]